MAEIKDVYENTQIISFLSVADTGKASKFWIGMSDLATQGTYAWDTSTSTFTYRFWATNEPSSKVGEDCVNIDSGPDRFWRNSQCTDTKFPLCQKGERAVLLWLWFMFVK